jgi:hypothetical protein
MEADPSLEFDHFLAAKLGMTVARMRTEMSNAEYMAWGMYYAREAQRRQLAQGGA